MLASFSYSILTELPRDQVWNLDTSITNWPKFSDHIPICAGTARRGRKGSATVGQRNYPIVVAGRYAIKKCSPHALIRYLSQTQGAGFATERTVALEQPTEEPSFRFTHSLWIAQMPGGRSALENTYHEVV
jgi:hypothetical protein